MKTSVTERSVCIREIVVYFKALQKFILASAFVGLCGCDAVEHFDPARGDAPVDVVLSVGEGQRTRTAYDNEAGRFVWNAGDRIAVWAKAQGGTFALNGQTFNLLAAGINGSDAYFTATLDSPMDEGTYSYYMAYPVPDSFEGTAARFTVPAEQDGLASDGIDIIVAEPVSGSALAPLADAAPINPDNVLNVKMKHLLHFLKFYIPEGKNILGEPVTRIEFTMPQAVAGNLSVDVTDASTATLSGGVKGMTLKLGTPLDEGGVAVAGIFPPASEYSSEDRMAVTIYSENKWSSLTPVSLEGRSFAAGHLTPVPLRPSVARPLLRFTLASNNLGEDLQSIRMSLPEGETWPGTDSNVLDFAGESGGLIKVGETFIYKVEDEDAFKSLSSKTLTVTYESESAVVTGSAAIGDLSAGTNTLCSLNCPYLFFEDFSGVEDLSSYDEWSMANAGSRKAKSFLNGWSAARFGAKAGTSLRLACRRETSVDYSARADSPFLSGLKDGVTVNLEVQFDYSMDRTGYATPGFKVPEIGQTVYIGHINTSESLESGDGTGDFPSSFTVNETGGSYTDIGHSYSAVLTNVNSPLRLSWRTVPEHKAGTSNNTCWLYIDNIKVKIKK